MFLYFINFISIGLVMIDRNGVFFKIEIKVVFYCWNGGYFLVINLCLIINLFMKDFFFINDIIVKFLVKRCFWFEVIVYFYGEIFLSFVFYVKVSFKLWVFI